MPQSSTTPFSGVFVSYRRDDSSGHAGRLFDRLASHFGKDRIFMDIDAIDPGEDFVAVIENAVSSCDILIAVIGKHWLSNEANSARRLDNPTDHVRLEIATALSRDIRVIPVLVQRASMPRPEDLPGDLATLSRRNAMELSDLRWQHDVDKLISVMEKVLAKRAEEVRIAETARQAKAELQRLEEAEKRRAEEEKQRIRQEQQRLGQEELKLRDAEVRRLTEEGVARSQAEQKRQKAQKASRLSVRTEPSLIGSQVERLWVWVKMKKKARHRRSQRKGESAEDAFVRRFREDRDRSSARSDSIARKITSSKTIPSRKLIVIACLASLVVIAIVVLVGISKTLRYETAVNPAATPTITPMTGQTTTSLPTAADNLTARPNSFTNKYGIEMVFIPPGDFMMGASDAEVQAAYENDKRYRPKANLEWFSDEKPQHPVTISQAFYMGKYEVTIGEWKTVMGGLPKRMRTNLEARFKESARQPIIYVSWHDAKAFIVKLNTMNDGYMYRLPTEAEWEYAARAGTTGEYAGDIDSMAWYANNSGKTQLDALAIIKREESKYGLRLYENRNKPHEVGGKQPNGFGLYDMFGNVWEWCEDWYHDTDDGAPSDGSAWLSGGTLRYRVLRGGSWGMPADVLRAAKGGRNIPENGSIESGFRVVATAQNQ